MTEIAGRKVKLIYHSDGDFGTAGATLANARTKGIKIDREFIDITTDDSAPNRKLMNLLGMVSGEITVACVTLGAAAHRTIVGLCTGVADGAQLHSFEIDAPGLGRFQADWFITSFNLGADYGPEASTIELTLASSGLITFVPTTD